MKRRALLPAPAYTHTLRMQKRASKDRNTSLIPNLRSEADTSTCIRRGTMYKLRKDFQNRKAPTIATMTLPPVTSNIRAQVGIIGPLPDRTILYMHTPSKLVAKSMLRAKLGLGDPCAHDACR